MHATTTTAAAAAAGAVVAAAANNDKAAINSYGFEAANRPVHTQEDPSIRPTRKTKEGHLIPTLTIRLAIYI